MTGGEYHQEFNNRSVIFYLSISQKDALELLSLRDPAR
jgi:hypothetical protein